jgi:hypothetical protein
MSPFRTDRIGRFSHEAQPGLTSVTDEVCATIARILAYVGTMALFGILGVHLWKQDHAAKAAGAGAGWSVSARAHPAFAVSQPDPLDKSVTYTILRHPEGGRKDILRWSNGTERPVAELEIYGPGSEWDASSAVGTGLAPRMQQIDASGLETAGIVESKFGTVALFRTSGAGERGGACLGFIKRIDQPRLEISGWSCQGDGWPARRAAVGCMLNRLTLLTAEHEPKLAELFARAELKRDSCVPGPSDWVTSAEKPTLRGTF